MDFRRKVKLDKDLLNKVNKKNLGLDDDGIDEDGHYDETKDRNFLKRFKKEFPKQYEEFMKSVRINDKEYED